MIEIKNEFGHIVRRSRNLRGIITHLASNLPDCVYIAHKNGTEGTLTIVFRNGDTVTTDFASFNVLLDWVNRRQMLYGCCLVADGNAIGRCGIKST